VDDSDAAAFARRCVWHSPQQALKDNRDQNDAQSGPVE
jgi:hypothetical protein